MLLFIHITLCFCSVLYSRVPVAHLFHKYNITNTREGPGGSMSQVVGLPNNSYKHNTNTTWFRARLCKLHKGCTRLAAASDKAYQLLAHGRWFSPGTPASSTTKTGPHDIAEILLNVALNTKNQSMLTVHQCGYVYILKPTLY